MPERRLAAVCREPGRRASAETVQAMDLSPVDELASGDLMPEIAASLAAFPKPLDWPTQLLAKRFHFEPVAAAAGRAATGDCELWCTEAWWRSVDDIEMAIDLAASTSPADWLFRMEDRLLEAASAEPGAYAALALWRGELMSEV